MIKIVPTKKLDAMYVVYGRIRTEISPTPGYMKQPFEQEIDETDPVAMKLVQNLVKDKKIKVTKPKGRKSERASESEPETELPSELEEESAESDEFEQVFPSAEKATKFKGKGKG